MIENYAKLFIQKNDSNLIINTIKKAIKKNKKDLNGLLLLLDQASVHICQKMRNFCANNNITLDFSNVGTPLDNAVKESEHSRFKCEFLYPNINKLFFFNKESYKFWTILT
ncbi:hypothetical protein [Spiroplasma sp. SV19]|uniref:hypothetical protein n=1 Tax=Spiroplasma sp. SV19 TaxID=2570468 RepID=UPI0024B7449F|nr:hypothetical protein [Spiroplasma sp. SV19]WHQ36577.1 DDE-type integrase/transposase/recombinase [Spiroplasma sp. SV19]